MTQAMQDLWPNDLGGSDESPPMTFLKEQAALLSKKTGGLVEAEVTSTADVAGFAAQVLSGLPDDPVIVIGFILRAPALGDYRYVLFRGYHAVERFYPMLIRFGREEVVVESAEELAPRLRGIFASSETRKVVGALIAQTKAMAS